MSVHYRPFAVDWRLVTNKHGQPTDLDQEQGEQLRNDMYEGRDGFIRLELRDSSADTSAALLDYWNDGWDSMGNEMYEECDALCDTIHDLFHGWSSFGSRIIDLRCLGKVQAVDHVMSPGTVKLHASNFGRLSEETVLHIMLKSGGDPNDVRQRWEHLMDWKRLFTEASDREMGMIILLS